MNEAPLPAIILDVHCDGRLVYPGGTFGCALGRGGISANKREGDGASPAGNFPLRRVFYRPDRLSPPKTDLPAVALDKNDAWCDDPQSPFYNRLVRLPFAPRHERLWRDDHLYDIIVEIGYNDAPPQPFLGSAVFIHLARKEYSPTRGCIALALADMYSLLRYCNEMTVVNITAP